MTAITNTVTTVVIDDETVGIVRGTVQVGDTATARLRDENGLPISATGRVTEILDEAAGTDAGERDAPVANDEGRTMNTNTETFDAYNAQCIRCGMPALRDPWLHAERYGHQPQFRREGKVFQFDTTQGVSREAK